jgi:hypothetical protein
MRTRRRFGAYPKFSGGSYPQGRIGAQVGASVLPRDAHATFAVRDLNASAHAIEIQPDPYDRHAFRPATYNQNWEGLLTWNAWQQMNYPNQYRNLLVEQSTQARMRATQQIYRKAPRPIAITQYALQAKTAALGNYKAILNREGGM